MIVVAFAFALGTSELGPGFLICSSQDSSSGRTIVYVGEPIHGADSDIPEFKRAFVDEVEKRYGIHLPYSGCATAETRKQAKEGFDYATEYPTRHNAAVVIVKWSGDRGQDWSSGADEPSEERQQAKAASTSSEDSAAEAASAGSSHRPKMTNAEADAKFAADKAQYEKKLAEQQKQVDDFKRAQDEVARKKQEQKLAAEQAAADYQRQLEAHTQTVRHQQLEYQKQAAKPAGGPNAVYRGFWARDCDAARKSATLGAGTSSTTRFKEVTNEPGNNGCVVQGWWWNVAGGGTATRQ